MHCAAAPVRDAGGRVVAAVSCSVPAVLLDGGHDIHDLIPAITTCTEAISADLGWIAPERT